MEQTQGTKNQRKVNQAGVPLGSARKERREYYSLCASDVTARECCEDVERVSLLQPELGANLAGQVLRYHKLPVASTTATCTGWGRMG